MTKALNATDPQDHAALTRVYHSLGTTRQRLGQHSQSETQFQQAIAHAEAIDHPAHLGVAYNALGVTCYDMGDLHRTAEYFERAYELFMEIGFQSAVASALNQLTGLYLEQGRYALAHDHALKAQTANQVAYLYPTDSLIEINLAEIAYHQEDYETARQRLQSAQANLQRIEQTIFYAIVLQIWGDMCYSEGGFDEAVMWYEQSLARFQKLGDATSEAKVQFGLGQVALRRGAHETALTYFEQSRNTLADNKARLHEARATTYLGFTYLRLEDARAAALFAQAIVTPQLIETRPKMLEVIIGFAWLRWQQQQLTEAARLLAFVQQHPARADHMRHLGLADLEQHLAAVLDSAEQDAIAKQAQQLTLEQVVAGLQSEDDGIETI